MDKIVTQASGIIDIGLINRALDRLTHSYPGYIWEVTVDDRPTGGVMNIYNKDVNEHIMGTPNYGYVLKLERVYQDPDLKCVMMAGGEILESANLSRLGHKDESVKKIDGLDEKKHPLIVS